MKKLPVVGKKAVPVAVSIQLVDLRLNLLFIGHPSRAFSWKRWGKLLQEHRMSPVQPESAETTMQAIFLENEALFKKLADA